MKIKALSLWQPWASLIALGAKKFETRSWKTSYRGPLLICASKKNFQPEIYTAEFLKALRFHGFFWSLDSRIPFGEALCVVDLAGCLLCGLEINRASVNEHERLFGDFTPGRYAWKLENVRAIAPFPVRGRQGLFEVEIPEGLI